MDSRSPLSPRRHSTDTINASRRSLAEKIIQDALARRAQDNPNRETDKENADSNNVVTRRVKFTTDPGDNGCEEEQLLSTPRHNSTVDGKETGWIPTAEIPREEDYDYDLASIRDMIADREPMDLLRRPLNVVYLQAKKIPDHRKMLSSLKETHTSSSSRISNAHNEDNYDYAIVLRADNEYRDVLEYQITPSKFPDPGFDVESLEPHGDDAADGEEESNVTSPLSPRDDHASEASWNLVNDHQLYTLLQTLRRGITVRRHIPLKRAQLVELASADGLRIITCSPVKQIEYGASRPGSSVLPACVSDCPTKIGECATGVHRLRFDTMILLEIRPAHQLHRGFFGTETLRQSQDIPIQARTFSLIFSSGGSPSPRNTLDIECLSDEDYKTLYSGFTRWMQVRDDGSIDLTKVDKEPPKERSTVRRRPRGRGKTEKERKQLPPDEQFLGWKAAGTQIYSRLRHAGFITKKVYSSDRRRLMLKLRLPDSILEEMAESRRYKVRQRDGTWKRFIREKRDDYQSASPWGGNVLFRSSERQQMIDCLIRSEIRSGGAELDERTWLGRQISARVPLHMSLRLHELRAVWVCYWSDPANGSTGLTSKRGYLAMLKTMRVMLAGALTQPLDLVAGYFGETIALYFAGLECYARWLLLPSFLGIVVFYFQVTSWRFDHPACCAYGIFISAWAPMLLIQWRRKTSELSYGWGVLDYEAEETIRLEFRGRRTQDPVTGEWTAQTNRFVRALIIAFTSVIVCTAVIVMLGVLNMLFAARDHAIQRTLDTQGDSLDHSKWNSEDRRWWFVMLFYPALYGLLVPTCYSLFKVVALRLTAIENHVTNSQYRNGLIWKIFSFKFVIVFSSLYYYAFAVSQSNISSLRDAKTAAQDAMLRVAVSLICFLTVSHWWQKLVLQIWIPRALYRWQIHTMSKKLRREQYELRTRAHKDQDDKRSFEKQARYLLQAASDVWQETLKKPYDTFDDYTLLLVQFGYVACFSMIFPLAPFFSLCNALVQIRLDAHKLCNHRQRPMAEKSGSIGIWDHVLQLMIVVAVITNCALIALTSTQLRAALPQFSTMQRVLLMILAEHILLFIGYFMQSMFPRIPPSVQRALARDRVSRSHELHRDHDIDNL